MKTKTKRQMKKDKPSQIQAGVYEVVKKGSRLVVIRPAHEACSCGSMSCSITLISHPASTVATFTMKQAKRLQEAYRAYRVLYGYRNDLTVSFQQKWFGFEVKFYASQITVGCTTISEATLDKICRL